MYLLPETELVKLNAKSGDENAATFVIEPLSPGYGVTVGNALRRVMLASLEGSAVSSVKIDGVNHEFTTIENMREDIVEFILNIKGLPVRLEGDDPVTITLDVSGPRKSGQKTLKLSPMLLLLTPNTPLQHWARAES